MRRRADSFGCLAIALIGAFFATWFLLGLGAMADLPDERTRSPLWQSSAIIMTFLFGGALALSTFAARRPDRRAVFVTGLLVALALYGWLAVPSLLHLQ